MFQMFSRPTLACFDGAAPPAAPPADPPAAPPADPPKEPSNEKAFDQNDLNTFLAEDRRKHQERYQKLEQNYEGLLQDKTLAADSRTRMESELEDLRASFRTKEQQIEFDKKKQNEQYEVQLTELQTKAEKFEVLYTDTVINQALQDAAVKGEAFNAEQIIALLRPRTDLRDSHDDEGKPTGVITPMTEFEDLDEKTGLPIKTLRTPRDAVKRMKELPELYGNLFRANVVSGIGQGAATGGVTSGKTGTLDPTKLTPEQYQKIRKENPHLLGLRPRQ